MSLLNELRVGDVSDDSVRSRVKNFFEFDIVQIYVAPRSVRLFAAVIKSASTIGLNNRPQQSASTIGLNYKRVLLLLPLLLFPLLLLLLLLLMLKLLQLLLLPLLLLTLLSRFQNFESGCEAAIFSEPRARSRKDDFTADRAASDCKK